MHATPRTLALVGLGFALPACGAPPDEAAGHAEVAASRSALVGAVQASEGDAPYLAQIATLYDGRRIHKCGGALLVDPYNEGASQWVVTAAHCTRKLNDEGERVNIPLDEYVVTLGEFDLDVEDGPEVRRGVAGLSRHRYHRDGSDKRNDIALLRLDSPVDFDSHIQPVYFADGQLEDGATAEAFGWGATTSPGGNVPILNKVTLPVVDQGDCAAAMNDADQDFSVDDSMICAGYADGQKSTCHADSGGPLVTYFLGNPVLHGITSWGGKRCDEYSVFTRASSFRQWIQKQVSFGTWPVCQGQTVAGDTQWQQYKDFGVYVDVDTSSCGETQTPVYITSLGGRTRHWTTMGASSIYKPTEKGFRLYVYKSGITPDKANSYDWHVSWQAMRKNVNAFGGYCSGQTSIADTNWQTYSTDGIYVDVDTSHCDKTETPKYFTSLGGRSAHWTAKGVTSIYQPTPTGFRVYLQQSGLTPSVARDREYHVNWIAAPDVTEVDFCTGSTPAHATDWKAYSSSGIYTDIDTGCFHTALPRYFTSLGGLAWHWTMKGTTSIYKIGPSSFRVYLNQSGITPELANFWGYHVNWGAYP